MIQRIRRFFLATWRSLVLVGTVVGLLYLWPDIQELPSAYGLRWGQVMPDRAALALILLGLALSWIVWIDVRPAARRWMTARTKHPLTIVHPEHAWVERLVVHSGPNTAPPNRVVKYVYKLGVRNDSERTIRRLALEFQFRDQIAQVPIQGTSETNVDLRPGAAIFFHVGRVFADENKHASLIEYENVSPEQLHDFRVLAEMRVFTFSRCGTNDVSLPLSDLSKDINTPFDYQFSADDMLPLKLKLKAVAHEEHYAALQIEIVPSFGR